MSTTLTGNNGDVIGDALRSVVDWVDHCLVIDTGVTDNTLDVARSICGDKLLVERFTWVQDFAAARNFALDVATRLGATWALTLDTDERIDLQGVDLRTTLQHTSARAILMTHRSGTYAKDRLFKLPCPVRWEGATHEAIDSSQLGRQTLERARFDELPPDASKLAIKLPRDAEILSRMTREDPANQRWWYYLGDVLHAMGRGESAFDAWVKAGSLQGWDEEGAWALYRAADWRFHQGRWKECQQLCVQGLTRHAGYPELAWLAGVCEDRMGRHQHAVWWAQMAIANGRYKGLGVAVERTAFRYPPAEFELPFDLLAHALAALGDRQGSQRAWEHFASAKALRESGAAVGIRGELGL